MPLSTQFVFWSSSSVVVGHCSAGGRDNVVAIDVDTAAIESSVVVATKSALGLVAAIGSGSVVV